MRTILITLFTLLSCGACLGQSSFQEITPGTSTREDVTRVLGQPLRSVGPALVEYAPPDGIAKVEVEFRNIMSRVSAQLLSVIVNRIEVYFVKPVSRQALVQQFDLPQVAEKKTSIDGKLVEYFGGTSLLALTYASADTNSGVNGIGYYSRELFDTTLAKAGGARQNPATQAGASRSGATGLGEINLPDYMRGPGGSKSATIDRAGRGSSSGGNSSSGGSGETKQTKNTAGTSRSSDGSLPMTVTARADGIEVQPSTRPGTTGNNEDDSAETGISMSVSELRRLVGTYEFTQPTTMKPAEVRLVGGKLRLTMDAATYTLAPILKDDFVVGDQGESDTFRFRAVGEGGVKVYFTIAEDKLQNLFIVDKQRQPKRFYIAVPKP